MSCVFLCLMPYGFFWLMACDLWLLTPCALWLMASYALCLTAYGFLCLVPYGLRLLMPCAFLSYALCSCALMLFCLMPYSLCPSTIHEPRFTIHELMACGFRLLMSYALMLFCSTALILQSLPIRTTLHFMSNLLCQNN